MNASTAPRLSRSLPPVYAAAVLRLLLPLVVLPLVASRAGSDEFGRLSFILVWSGLLAMLVEGGFLAAATRHAVTADSPSRWLLAQQVFSARCVLSIATALLAAVAAGLASDGPGSAQALDAASIAALSLALGWPATWYLQATQQLHRWARVEIVVYGSMLALCIAFADSAGRYVAFQLAASVLLASLGWSWLRKDLAATGERLWQPRQVAAGLRLGWTMLPVSIAGAAYSFALPAAASLQMAKAELGVYFMADRIVRAALASADPVYSLVYPRLVVRLRDGLRQALRYALRWAAGGVLVGIAAVAVCALAWPMLQSWLAVRAGEIDLQRLGSVLQVLCWLLPMLLGWKFIGYWMLGSGRYDAAYRICVVVGGVVGVAAAATWGGAAGAVGLAWTALGVEAIVIMVAVAGILTTHAWASTSTI